jgi:hypothetical protein
LIPVRSTAIFRRSLNSWRIKKTLRIYAVMFLPGVTFCLMEKAMNRYWLAAALALCISGISACNRNEGMLPKTDGDQSAQSPRPAPDHKPAAPVGKAASDGY